MLTLKLSVLSKAASHAAAAAVAMVVVLVASRVSEATAPPAAARTARAAAAPVEPQGLQFHRFAMNGLLATLIDDAEPPRWTTVAVPLMCGGGTHISVDDQPLQDGALVPRQPFMLRWQADGCSPFGEGAVLLHGPVALYVYRQGNHLAAVVDARALQLRSSTGVALPAGVFGATLALGPGVQAVKAVTNKAGAQP